MGEQIYVALKYHFDQDRESYVQTNAIYLLWREFPDSTSERQMMKEACNNDLRKNIWYVDFGFSSVLLAVSQAVIKVHLHSKSST